MSKITYPTKTTGDTFSGAEATEIKTVVNANDDALIALNTRTSNVDNTSDVDKPVSTLQATADSDTLNSANGYTDAKVEGLQYKNPVAYATVANTTLNGGQIVDGVSVSLGMRILVKDQTDQKENGIYIVAAGAWTRSPDMNANAEIPLARVEVAGGTVNGGKAFKCTNTTVVLGTDNIVFAEVVVSGLIPTSEKGAAGGVATLGADIRLPLAQGAIIGTVTPNNSPITLGNDLQAIADKAQGQIDQLQSDALAFSLIF